MKIRGAARRLLSKNLGLLKIAEIGVRRGENAHFFLQDLPVQELWLIDPYLPYLDCGLRQEQPVLDAQRIDMLQRLKDYRDVLYFLQIKSEDAAKLFPDNYFDFVYIDGDHSYSAVMIDCESWLSKIREGGILGGHDYNCLVSFPDITKAVNEFAERHHLTVISCMETDWAIDL